MGRSSTTRHGHYGARCAAAWDRCRPKRAKREAWQKRSSGVACTWRLTHAKITHAKGRAGYKHCSSCDGIIEDARCTPASVATCSRTCIGLLHAACSSSSLLVRVSQLKRGFLFRVSACVLRVQMKTAMQRARSAPPGARLVGRADRPRTSQRGGRRPTTSHQRSSVPSRVPLSMHDLLMQSKRSQTRLPSVGRLR